MSSVHTILQRISAFFAVLNNLILIVLIIFKSHKKIGKYKYLMIYISIFEIIYAILDTCAVPEIYTTGSAFLVTVLGGQSFLPTYLCLLLSELFCVLFGISMAIFAIHFIYRYMVVSENKYLKKYDAHVISFLLILPLLFGVFWFWVVDYFLTPFDKADKILKEHFLDKMNINLTDVSYVGPYFWPIGKDGKTYVQWKSMFGILIMSIAITVSFSTIFVFGYKCYRKTNELIQSASQSESFNKLQTQLFYSLVLQTLIPVVLMHIPATIGFGASFFGVSFEFLGEMCAFTICLYPALDPLPNFFIIKTYRDAILKYLRKFKSIILCKGATVDIEIVAMSDLGSASMTPKPASLAAPIN
ncbi:Serpentine receptor class r-10 [Caenorhabditis elegans]|uniref:Serpentine receptor class r-10 n=1 Tax=Caenorhabditis elegans TaxID=6239 RepID=O62028_CAEEL|nr:Seven TM Receptor [Caenorhabditis elegans]CAB01122.1 Seven TM Receptor [Caenorhabditis elegans]|eukprot:NP_506453.1 Seven TM Receptor [Caenorhabditis elegans]